MKISRGAASSYLAGYLRLSGAQSVLKEVSVSPADTYRWHMYRATLGP